MKSLLLLSTLLLASCTSTPDVDFCNRIETAIKQNNFDDLEKLYQERLGNINATEEEKQKLFVTEAKKCNI